MTRKDRQERGARTEPRGATAASRGSGATPGSGASRILVHPADVATASASARHPLLSDVAILFYIALAKFVLHLLTNGSYGYHRDELYYIACGNHLAWGFVDHPPLTPFIARIVTTTIGSSLQAIRFVPALAGAATVFVAGRIAKEAGGSLFAQALTALAVLVGANYLFFGTLLTTNVFDQLFWALCLYLFIVVLRRGEPSHWIWLSVVFGLGLLNKHTMVFLDAALFGGLLLTVERERLKERWPWIAFAVAILIFLPNLIWEVRTGWPTIEFLQRAEINRMPTVSPWLYFVGQAMGLHVLLVPVWLIGLWRAFASRERSWMRPIAVAYVLLFIYFVLTRAKHYYLIPFYPPLLAFGAIWLERVFHERRLRWAPAVVVVVLLAGSAVTAPMSLPVLAPEALIAYSQRLPGAVPPAPGASAMPEVFQDMFGWEEMVADVADAYHALPHEDRAVAAVNANNYGQAAAIDFFGEDHGLPKAISTHNAYWYWGPRDYTGDVMLTVGVRPQALSGAFESGTIVGTVEHDYVVWYETNQPIIVWRDMKIPLRDAWSRMKLFY